MKKLISILLAGCLFLLGACSSSSPSTGSEDSLSEIESSKGTSSFSKEYVNSGKQQKIYSNEELGFSFKIPREWSADEYKIVVSHGKQQEDESTYSQIDFIFRSDKENPLLRIYVVTSKWWAQYGSDYDSALLRYLGKQGDTAYCYVLPTDRSYLNYAEESAAEIYASMVLSSDEVEEAFTIIKKKDTP